MVDNKTILDTIERCLGSEMLSYAKNKNRGGRAGKKGSCYEDYFLAYKATEVAAGLLRQGVALENWPIIGSQIPGFVDDVVIEMADRVEFYQLKNATRLSWHGGEHPLETDFSCQYKLALELGLTSPRTWLVVPSEELRSGMSDTMPQSIAAHTEVRFFADKAVLNRYVLENTELQEHLAQLTSSATPKLDDLVAAFGVVMLAVTKMAEQGGCLSELLEATREIYPYQIRSLVADMGQHIRPDFKAILDSIEGLQYSVERGFFQWNGFGTTGVFPVVCSHPDFGAFQALIMRKRPETFDDFEGLL